jgi:hypothetical protein
LYYCCTGLIPHPDVGNHVLAESLKWRGAWQEGKTPNVLAKSLFKKVVRRELQLDFSDIDINEPEFKGKPETFWEGPGQEILSVILEAMGGAGARQLVGEKTKPTTSMQIGMVPTAADIQVIAQSSEFEKFRQILNGEGSDTERFEALRKILDAETAAAKLLKKCAMFTGELTAVPVKEEDSSRVLVTDSQPNAGALCGCSSPSVPSPILWAQPSRTCLPHSTRRGRRVIAQTGSAQKLGKEGHHVTRVVKGR